MGELIRKYMSNIHRTLDGYDNIFCLDLLRQLDESANMLTCKLRIENHYQLPSYATKLRNSLKDIFLKC